MPAPTFLRLLGAAFKNFLADEVPRLGASLSYYTLFALAPMLVVTIAVASTVFSEELVRGEIVGQIDQLIGSEGAATIEGLLQNAQRDRHGTLATVIGAFAFLLASTGAFLELQAALNKIWRVKPKPGMKVKSFLLNRAQSFALVVGMGFLLLVSLVVSAALAAFSNWLQGGAAEPTLLWNVVNLIVSLVVVTLLFAALFKVLPDVKLEWLDVLIGAFATALLFTIGKQLIGLYLGQSAVASTYGAAGSIVVMLLWIYYSSQIILFGAEFTRQYADHRHSNTPRAESFARKTSKRKAKVAG